MLCPSDRSFNRNTGTGYSGKYPVSDDLLYRYSIYYSVQYYQFYFPGNGRFQKPMYFIGIACMGNIVLDYFFIGAMQLGPAGAALGTTLSPDIQCDHCPDLNDEKKDRDSSEKTDFRPNKKVMWQILRVGFPVAVQDGCIQIAFIIITVIANHRGLNDAAAVGIVEK